jgi:type II restriction enzyme
MILDLPVKVAKGYRSLSQIARVVTEAWTLANMYCPACAANKLIDTANNTEAIDFVCKQCDCGFQLKAKSGVLGRKIVDAGYDAMMRSIAKNRLPHFLFLGYNKSHYTVNDLVLVPNFCLGPSAIEARKPLSPTARRAGWVGCNIILDSVPPEGKIPIISSGSIAAKETVRKKFQQVKPLENLSVKMRGWTLDVLTVLRSIDGREFTLKQAYSFETVLSQMHPDNKHVRDKIRQQLQVLRDLGYLQFVKRGVYRWAKGNL